MFKVSKDSPGYYLTSVGNDRLPIFRKAEIAEVVCNALDEARRSGGFLIFSYVVMPNHLHIVTGNSRSPSDTHRFVNGIISRRLINHLKEKRYDESLAKLRIAEQAKGYKHSLWQHHPNTRLLWNEEMLLLRINYTHLNPVRAGLVEHPDAWPWSSSRIWHKLPHDTEPLSVDTDKIGWRQG